MDLRPADSPPETLRGYLRRGLARWRPGRPVSLFLMFAMIVALILGAQIGYVRDDPKRFAFVLSLLFIFFMVVIARAVVDFFEVIREHLREREGLFRETFTKDGFSEELGRRVAKGDPGSWPE